MRNNANGNPQILNPLKKTPTRQKELLEVVEADNVRDVLLVEAIINSSSSTFNQFAANTFPAFSNWLMVRGSSSAKRSNE